MAAAVRQSKFFSGSSTADYADATFDSAVLSGSLIVCVISRWETINPAGMTCEDTVNGSHTLIQSTNWNYSGNDWAAFSYYQNSAAGTPTVTVTRTTSTGQVHYFSICIVEITGVATTGALEASNAAVDTASPISSGNVSSAGAAIFIGLWCQDTRDMDPTFASFTEIFEVNIRSFDIPITLGYRIVTGATTDDYDATYTGGNIPGWAGLAAFKEPGGGGGGGVIVQPSSLTLLGMGM